MPEIESLANINQYIIAKVGAGRDQVAQLLGTMFTIALAAYQDDLPCIKRADV